MRNKQVQIRTFLVGILENGLVSIACDEESGERTFQRVRFVRRRALGPGETTENRDLPPHSKWSRISDRPSDLPNPRALWQRWDSTTKGVWTAYCGCETSAAYSTTSSKGGSMRRFVIEREIPEVGTLERDQLRAASEKSNEALAKLAPDIQWVESFVADDRTFCIYLAKNEDVIRKHAEISGFPANRIVEISKKIDPTTAQKS